MTEPLPEALQRRQGGVRHRQDGAHIEIHHPVIGVVVILAERDEVGEAAGIVDEDVQPAEAFNRLLDHGARSRPAC